MLLLTTEDACVQDFDLADFDIQKVIMVNVSGQRSPLVVSDAVVQFDQNTLDDTAARLGFETVHAKPDSLVDALTGAETKANHHTLHDTGPIVRLDDQNKKATRPARCSDY